MSKEDELSKDGSLVGSVEASAAAATPNQCPHDPVALVDSADLAAVAGSVGVSRVSTEVEAVAGSVVVLAAVVVAAAASEEVTPVLEEIETASAEHPAGHHLVLEVIAETAIAALPVDLTLEEDEALMTDLVAATVTVVGKVIVTAVVVQAATWNLSDAGMVGIAKEIVTVTVTVIGIAIGKETEEDGTSTDLMMTIAESVDMKVVMRIPESCDDTKSHSLQRQVTSGVCQREYLKHLEGHQDKMSRCLAIRKRRGFRHRNRFHGFVSDAVIA